MSTGPPRRLSHQMVGAGCSLRVCRRSWPTDRLPNHDPSNRHGIAVAFHRSMGRQAHKSEWLGTGGRNVPSMRLLARYVYYCTMNIIAGRCCQYSSSLIFYNVPLVHASYSSKTSRKVVGLEPPEPVWMPPDCCRLIAIQK